MTNGLITPEEYSKELSEEFKKLTLKYFGPLFDIIKEEKEKYGESKMEEIVNECLLNPVSEYLHKKIGPR